MNRRAWQSGLIAISCIIFLTILFIRFKDEQKYYTKNSKLSEEVQFFFPSITTLNMESKDIRAKIKLNKDYVIYNKFNQFNNPPDHSFVMPIKVTDLSPIYGNYRSQRDSVIMILSIIPKDAIEAHINLNSPRYVGNVFENLPKFYSESLTLDIQTNYPERRNFGPKEVLYTKNGNNSFYIEC